MRYIEKQVVLQTLDHLWREHLVTLDHLRQVIGWRGMAQRDPLNEYKSEAFELFGELIHHLREPTTAQLNHVEVTFEAPPPPPAGDAVRGPASAGRRPCGPRPDFGNGGAPRPARTEPAQLPNNGRRRRAPGERSLDLGQGRSQRALPLRLGQEI